MRLRRVAAGFGLAFSLVCCPVGVWGQQVPAAAPEIGDSAQAAFRAKAALEDADRKAWVEKVQAALVAGQFDELDRQADGLRQQKERWPGGTWKLSTFYVALDSPSGTDAASDDHLARLERWVKLRPESITARVGLALSLARWAWVARGNAPSQGVHAGDFSVFFARLKQAREVLDSAAGLRTMCPEWYYVMLLVGRSQQWNRKEMDDVLERGEQFAPDFQAMDQEMARYLLPQWYGKAGDVDRFAKEAGDRLGGDAGDLLYFQIVGAVMTPMDGGRLGPDKDWPRLQRGYGVLVREFGETRAGRNQYAYMAAKCDDAATARAELQLIGDDWDPGVWLRRDYFDRVRDWAQDPSSQ